MSQSQVEAGRSPPFPLPPCKRALVSVLTAASAFERSLSGDHASALLARAAGGHASARSRTLEYPLGGGRGAGGVRAGLWHCAQSGERQRTVHPCAAALPLPWCLPRRPLVLTPAYGAQYGETAKDVAAKRGLRALHPFVLAEADGPEAAAAHTSGPTTTAAAVAAAAAAAAAAVQTAIPLAKTTGERGQHAAPVHGRANRSG